MKNLFGLGMICTILINFGVNILIQVISALSLLPKVYLKLKNMQICRKKQLVVQEEMPKRKRVVKKKLNLRRAKKHAS